MNYKDSIQAIDPLKALGLLDLNPTLKGKYIYFTCIECQKLAATASFGEKKNVWYCPECKAKGQIISLTMKLKGLEYEKARDLLLKEAAGNGAPKVKEEFTLSLELEYHDYLKGITPEFCTERGIGYSKKGTMAGHIAVPIHDEKGMKVGYVGINVKTNALKFPKNINPEKYLFNAHKVNIDEEVFLTTNLMDCLKFLNDGAQAISNFGLPYLSAEQLSILQYFKFLSLYLEVDYVKEISFQLATKTISYHRFMR